MIERASILSRACAGRIPAGRMCIAAAALAALLAPVAGAQVVKEQFWIPGDGGVSAIAVSGNTIYLAGGFNSFGPASGAGVPLSAASGNPVIPFPKVAGDVEAVAPDGAGGWYIGGTFHAIDGVPRINLGHVLADGSVAAWNPGTGMEWYADVRALAASGSTVYVGGLFANIGGQARPGLAAVDAVTGAVTAWNPAAGAAAIEDIVVDGSTVYAAGVGPYLAALDATTAATIWSPTVTGQAVRALLLDGSTLYVGGAFTALGGQSRGRIAALDAATGSPTSWNPAADGTVIALAKSGSTLYAAGTFANIGGQPRARIAALDLSSAAALAWDPGANGTIRSLAAAGSAVYACGAFTTIGGQSRNYIAALDAATGAATAWNPNASSEVRALAVSGSTVYAGGWFRCMGNWVVRNGLAALDATTGHATSWNPDASGSVSALVVDGSTVYVGGQFTSVGGQARSAIAALDAATGAATAWNPNATGFPPQVFTLALSGGTVYAGGMFDGIGGQARNGIAALDATTGSATGWDPDAGANGQVWSLVSSGGTVYAGGQFTGIGGQARNNIAALDATTGAATAWNPIADDIVHALAVSGSTVYAGGSFFVIGGEGRTGLAALDAGTGAASAWNPVGDGYGYSLAVDGPTVYTGGGFVSIGGQDRAGIAALDATTGNATAWDPNSPNPDVNSAITTIALSGNTMYVGGGFRHLGVHPQAGFAAISLSTVSVPEGPAPRSIELAQNRPNPAGRSTLIEFTLPEAAPVTLSVFDLQGRRVASVLEGEMRPAGVNRIPFRAAGLASGLYVYRVEALGRVAARKMIVVE